MDSAKNQLVDKLKTANNILVTVSKNPSVDQLSALLGLTLLLNKQGKHAAAVFSGEVPSTLEFLQPDDTIEKNTDSLRDFIIALDKGKADKLRYKVEDNVVRIFITPYKTSISQEDLEFSQGDFNVDVVVALGVKQQEDLDEAITAHGRILHDATVASINIAAEGGLGSINWQDPQASSLSELVTELAQGLGDGLLDNQIATALLTGIVAETNRFSNDKTSSLTMSASAALMAAGANQQLVASKLEEGDRPPEAGDTATTDDTSPKSDDGTLDIAHDQIEDQETTEPEVTTPVLPEPNFDEPAPEPEESAKIGLSDGPKLITEPPTLGGTLTANSRTDGLDPTTDPLSLPSAEPPQMLSHDSSTASNQLGPIPEEPAAPVAYTPPPVDWKPPQPAEDPLHLASEVPTTLPSAAPEPESADHTLAELEQSVHSTHIATPDEIDAARNEVNKALTSSAAPAPAPAPIAALNSQPMGGNLHAGSGLPAIEVGPDGTLLSGPDATPSPAPAPAPSDTSQVIDPTAPPPVPPPIPFQFGSRPGGPQQNQ